MISPFLLFSKIKVNGLLSVIWIFFVLGQHESIQSQTINKDTLFLKMAAAVDSGLASHPVIINADLEMEKARLKTRTFFASHPLEFYYLHGQSSSSLMGKAFSVTQEIGNPVEWIYQSKQADKLLLLTESGAELKKRKLIVEIKSAFTEWLYYSAMVEIMQKEKALYSNFLNAYTMHYQLGEISLLQKSLAETRYYEMIRKYDQLLDQLLIAENNLRQLTGIRSIIKPAGNAHDLYKVMPPSGNQIQYNAETELETGQLKIDIAREQTNIEKSRFYPSITAGYIHQNINNYSDFQGFLVGLSFPLWFYPRSAEIKKSKIEMLQAENDYEYQFAKAEKTIENLIFELNKHYRQIRHYNLHGLQTSNLLMQTAESQYQNEEINYMEYVQHMSTAFEIKHGYLETVKSYNLTAIQLEYYANQ
ncbi:MAG: TolC family protein [Bacteroidota bacterium]